MVETIGPAGRGGKGRGAGLLHVLGATASAALLGGLLGAVGALLLAPWGGPPESVAGAAALLWAGGALGLPVPVPEAGRQVPEWWRTFFSPRTAALLYGLGLGTGFPFRLGFGTLAVAAFGIVLVGRPVLGAAILAAFGLTRGLAVVVGAGVPKILERLERIARSRIPAAANAAVLLVVALAALRP